MPLGHTTEYFAEHKATATAREIAQQGDMWRQVPALLAKLSPEHLATIKAALADRQASIVFSGAGTSGYVGDILAPAVAKYSPAHSLSRHSTDLVADPAGCLPKNAKGLLFAFARSGNSPESVDSLVKTAAVAPNVVPVTVTCNPKGQLAQAQDVIACLMPELTHDESFVMTSSFSTMTVFTAALCRHALGLPIDEVEPLAQQSHTINEHFYTSEICSAIAGAGRVIYLGSSSLWGSARESALKILEMTAGKIPTMAETSLGFRHGPKSLVNSETAVVIFASNDAYTQQFDRDIALELAEDGKAKMVLVSGTTAFFNRYPELAQHANITTYAFDSALDKHHDETLAVLHVNIGQHIGLKASLNNHISPDNPSPDGSVNRVVKGVTLYPYPHR